MSAAEEPSPKLIEPDADAKEDSKVSNSVLEDVEDIMDLLHKDGFVLRCKLLPTEAVESPCTDPITALSASTKILVSLLEFAELRGFISE